MTPHCPPCVSTPAKYYNTEAQYFSTTLDHPQNLSTVQVVNLVNNLLSTSSLKNPIPFHFLAPDSEGTVLVPATPPTIPAVDPSVPPPPPVGDSLPQAPIPAVSLNPPPLSPPAVEVEGPSTKAGGKNKRQRTTEDSAKTDNGHGKRKKSKRTKPDIVSGQSRGRKSKQSGSSQRKSSRIKNPGPVAAAGPRKKKTKHQGWAWVDEDGNEVEDSD
ncbi:hypothetical protein DFH06DRAFT_1149845 [Mycena polygramma]|nr:hypothetical protein DFH06DRAFT_1149845 [Mycena polygramma]